jgi:hypothetical protein
MNMPVDQLLLDAVMKATSATAKTILESEVFLGRLAATIIEKQKEIAFPRFIHLHDLRVRDLLCEPLANEKGQCIFLTTVPVVHAPCFTVMFKRHLPPPPPAKLGLAPPSNIRDPRYDTENFSFFFYVDKPSDITAVQYVHLDANQLAEIDRQLTQMKVPEHGLCYATLASQAIAEEAPTPTEEPDMPTREA